MSITNVKNQSIENKSDITSEYMEEIQHLITNNKSNPGSSRISLPSTLSFLPTTPPTSVTYNNTNKISKKDVKGKSKAIHNENVKESYKSNTTDKLIALISQSP